MAALARITGQVLANFDLDDMQLYNALMPLAMESNRVVRDSAAILTLDKNELADARYYSQILAMRQ